MSDYSLNDLLLQDSLVAIDRIVSTSGEPLEGNCLYRHHSDFKLHLANKEPLRRNLFELCRNAGSVLEIGFNAGHSCVLFLYANPGIEIVALDLCEHAYTRGCAAALANFGNVVLIEGDSGRTVPKFNPGRYFDLILVDGGHSQTQSLIDIINCRKFADAKTLLIVDDANLGGIAKGIDYLVAHRVLKEVEYEHLGLEKTEHHRIFNFT